MSANPKKWSNTLKHFVGNLPTNCLNVFDHFVGFALKVLRLFFVKPVAIFHLNNAWLYLKEIDNGKMVVVCIWYKYMILKLKFVFNFFNYLLILQDILKKIKCDILKMCLLLCEIRIVTSYFEALLRREIFDTFSSVLHYH